MAYRLSRIARIGWAVGLAALAMVGCGGLTAQEWWSYHTQCPVITYYDLAWSPDGTKIVYEGDPDSQGPPYTDLFIFEISHPESIQQLTHNNTAEDPTWSPDGKSIAYVTDNGIYQINVDGTGTKALNISKYDQLAWSPDGTTLAATTLRHGQSMIALIPLQGGYSPHVLETATGEKASWSPDGKHLVFAYGPGFSMGQISVMDSDGSNPEQLTTVGDNSQPVWSPDGKLIAYVGPNSQYLTDIRVFNLATKTITTITTGEHPSWSPDSKQIAFIGIQSHHNEIETINIDGTGLTRLTHNATGGICLH